MADDVVQLSGDACALLVCGFADVVVTTRFDVGRTFASKRSNPATFGHRQSRTPEQAAEGQGQGDVTSTPNTRVARHRRAERQAPDDPRDQGVSSRRQGPGDAEDQQHSKELCTRCVR